MKAKKGFLCTKLEEHYYILPYGQSVLDNHNAIKVNDTGAYLWQLLQEEHTQKQLVEKVAAYYEASSAQADSIARDVDFFLRLLLSHDMLESSQSLSSTKEDACFFMAGPLTISLSGSKDLFSQYFSAFSCPPKTPDLEIGIHRQKPYYGRTGQLLLRNEEIAILEDTREYIFLFPSFPSLYEMTVAKDGSCSAIYCDPKVTKESLEALFHAIRFPVLLAAQNQDLFFLHSASLEYQKKAWLFSGSSGTGKSTHTNLWKSLFSVPLLNGDLNMIGFQKDTLMAYGQPWCGTSQITFQGAIPLGGIVFLKQSNQDHVITPSKEEQILFLIQRSISPAWSESLFKKNIKMAKKIAARTSVFQLECTKEPTAAILMRQAIDALSTKDFH